MTSARDQTGENEPKVVVSCHFYGEAPLWVFFTSWLLQCVPWECRRCSSMWRATMEQHWKFWMPSLRKDPTQWSSECTHETIPNSLTRSQCRESHPPNPLRWPAWQHTHAQLFTLTLTHTPPRIFLTSIFLVFSIFSDTQQPRTHLLSA